MKRLATMTACLAAALAVAGAATIRAGTIVREPEPLERAGAGTGVDGSSLGATDLERATWDYRRGDFASCLKWLGRMVRAHPEMPPAHALFAKLAFQNNQASLIRPALEQAVAEDPQHPEVFLLFGDLALLEGRLTDASLHFERAVALAAAPRWTAPQRAHFEELCHEGDARIAESRGDWKAARAALEAWLKLDPTNAAARRRLGKALFGLGERQAAYDELNRAAREDAALEPAAITMGWLYSRSGDPEKAQEWMDRAARTAPDSLGVHLGLAAWHLERGRPDAAQAHADAAARLAPGSIGVRRLLGLAARARKDLARSESIFRAMAQESPGDAWVRNQLALVLAEQADEAKRREALELAQLGVRQAPNHPGALATLGMVYYRLRRLDECEKLLRSVVDGGQGSSDAAYVLARARADRGHPEEAPALLKAALEAPGFFASRDEARRWLDRLTLASQ